ncbi:hypothetical protein POM88_035734 [Heracleum sosnowskyi]|uniref:RING-type E3 ubiquitin transferase n=1 Tax=Heracleum sosnowskyi TaxID=360622 RepID=A0AAD8HNW2_9APIA|nr:hypothetical protein POM88_035734 [Heracleum sosnowskyi]
MIIEASGYELCAISAAKRKLGYVAVPVDVPAPVKQVKALEGSYAEESRRKKEIEEALARGKEEIEKLKPKLDDAMKELQLALEQKSSLEFQTRNSDEIVQELEQKIFSAVHLLQRYKKERDELLLEQIKEATHNFDPSLKIGEGGYGSIYRGVLRHTQVAVKVLHSNSSQGNLEFEQEYTFIYISIVMAQLALSCCEMSRNKRPELISEVWRMLEPMKFSCGASSFRRGSEDHFQIPQFYMCPIFQEIMQEPVVASDGYTYETEAIKGWLERGNDTSPMTDQKLANDILIPNHALRSAIQEWLQQP